MKFRNFVFILGLSSISLAQAAQKNLCDDLIEGGTSTPDQIRRCQDKLGVSDYAKEQEMKRKLEAQSAKDKEEVAKANNASDVEKKNNLETKTFSQSELVDAGFGKPFYAIERNYNFNINGKPKETRITEGDALCSYLGYEKATKSTVSSEIGANYADKKGLVVDTRWLIGSAKDPELYHEDNPSIGVMKYESITCVKRKNKNIDPSKDVYKKITEDLVILPEEINTPQKDQNTGVNDGSRSQKQKQTPNGYVNPWGDESSTGTSK